MFSFTHHAERRLQQRGMRPVWIDLLLRYADLDVPVGDGCVALSLSRHALTRLKAEHGPSLADRIRHVVLVVAGDAIVTVLHANGSTSRYWRLRGN